VRQSAISTTNGTLVFRPAESLKGGAVPAHGSRGPGHFALGIPNETLDEWCEHLGRHGVAIEQELPWPQGATSLYLRDPAGNSVELVTPG
jgi:catechol 2,3-dioxygenase-like lactoylglutathione lyase family enzyme